MVKNVVENQPLQGEERNLQLWLSFYRRITLFIISLLVFWFTSWALYTEQGVFETFYSFANALFLANITACQRHRTRALGLAGNPPPGTFVPHCKADGSYDDVQCHGYTGLCWCVDERGNEILGSRKWGRPHCARLPPGKRIRESIGLFCDFLCQDKSVSYLIEYNKNLF